MDAMEKDGQQCKRVTVQIGRVGDVAEWAAVEFQGVFVVHDGAPREACTDAWTAPAVVALGTLTVTGATATFAVGNSRLSGAVVDLHTPLLVCEQVAAADPRAPVQHRVVGFLRKKIIFTKRPKTV